MFSLGPRGEGIANSWLIFYLGWQLRDATQYRLTSPSLSRPPPMVRLVALLLLSASATFASTCDDGSSPLSTGCCAATGECPTKCLVTTSGGSSCTCAGCEGDAVSFNAACTTSACGDYIATLGETVFTAAGFGSCNMCISNEGTVCSPSEESLNACFVGDGAGCSVVANAIDCSSSDDYCDRSDHTTCTITQFCNTGAQSLATIRSYGDMADGICAQGAAAETTGWPDDAWPACGVPDLSGITTCDAYAAAYETWCTACTAFSFAPPAPPPPPSLGFVLAFVVVGLTAVLFLVPLLFIMCCPQCCKSCKSAEAIEKAEAKRHEAQDQENARHPVIYGSAVM